MVPTSYILEAQYHFEIGILLLHRVTTPHCVWGCMQLMMVALQSPLPFTHTNCLLSAVWQDKAPSLYVTAATFSAFHTHVHKYSAVKFHDARSSQHAVM